jgi:hypothetical protein
MPIMESEPRVSPRPRSPMGERRCSSHRSAANGLWTAVASAAAFVAARYEGATQREVPKRQVCALWHGLLTLPQKRQLKRPQSKVQRASHLVKRSVTASMR